MAKASWVCSVLLRLLALAATISAAIVMATSHQTATFFSITIEAKFQYTPAFQFFVIANAIAAVYTLITLFVRPSSSLSRPMIVFDVVIAMMLVASIAAAGAVGQVGKKGNEHAGWLPICDQIHKFCNQVTGAMICGIVGTVAYLFIVVHTIHTVLPLFP